MPRDGVSPDRRRGTPRDMRDDGPGGRALDAAMTVLGAVRTQLGVPWEDLSLGTHEAIATFVVQPRRTADILHRRRQLLSEYVGNVVWEHDDRIRGRMLAARHARGWCADTRARTKAVQDHVDRVRVFLQQPPG